MRSKFAEHAARRGTVNKIRSNAPRVSPTIELDYIRKVRKLTAAFHGEIASAIASNPTNPYATFSRLINQSRDAIEAFHPAAYQTAKRLEKYSKAEAVRTIGPAAKELPVAVEGFADNFAADSLLKLDSLMADTVTEALTAEGDTSLLADIFDKWMARSVNSASNSITQSSGELNRDRQVDAGVEGFYWISMHDARVRPEHAALDNGEVYSWDGEPPLSAEDSSSGIACFPGEDWSCRCGSSPAVKEQSSDDEVDEAA